MNDLRILRVQVVERVEQLIGPGQDLIRRKRSALAVHHFRQVVAGDELHHEKLPVALREMIADARQRRMMQTSEQSRLALELFAQTLVRKQRLLQRYSRIETLIDGLVNGAHATLTELAHDAIASLKDCVWRQHQ